MKTNFIKGISWFIVSLIVSVSLDIIQKHLGSKLTSYEITFYRFLLAAITLLPFVCWKGIKEGNGISQYWKIHLLRGLLLLIAMVTWCYGLTFVPISTAIALNYSIPFFTLILSIPLLGESVNKDRWITTFIGFIGVLVILNPSSVDFNLSSLSLIASSFLFALSDVLNKKYVHKETMLNMLFYTALFTCLFGAYPALAHSSHTFSDNVGLFIALGIGANFLFYCLLKAFKYMEASALAPFRYCDFIISALFGFLFFAEKPTNATYLGFIIIVPCTLYLTYKENRANV